MTVVTASGNNDQTHGLPNSILFTQPMFVGPWFLANMLIYYKHRHTLRCEQGVPLSSEEVNGHRMHFAAEGADDDNMRE